MQSESDTQSESNHQSEGPASADSNTSAGSVSHTKSDDEAEIGSPAGSNAPSDGHAPPEVNTEPEIATQSEDITQPEATTQPEAAAQSAANRRPESIASSESAIQPGDSTQPDENAKPVPFHVRKKSREEVKVEAAEHQTSAMTPGLKEHPVQEHFGRAACAVPMHETPVNIDDRWTQNSCDKPEAKTPMGSMTATHINEDLDMYNCGLCGETNEPRRERCKKCQNRLGGERW